MSELNEKYKLVLDTIKAYPAQLKQAWDEINEMKLTKEKGAEIIKLIRS